MPESQDTVNDVSGTLLAFVEPLMWQSGRLFSAMPAIQLLKIVCRDHFALGHPDPSNRIKNWWNNQRRHVPSISDKPMRLRLRACINENAGWRTVFELNGPDVGEKAD